jgi:hypothetical protein
MIRGVFKWLKERTFYGMLIEHTGKVASKAHSINLTALWASGHPNEGLRNLKVISWLVPRRRRCTISLLLFGPGLGSKRVALATSPAGGLHLMADSHTRRY